MLVVVRADANHSNCRGLGQRRQCSAYARELHVERGQGRFVRGPAVGVRRCDGLGRCVMAVGSPWCPSFSTQLGLRQAPIDSTDWVVQPH